MSSIRPVIKQLEEIFEKANERFYEGELVHPVIAVNLDITSGAYGWFTCWKAWQQEGTDGYYEINICAEHLNRPIADLVSTLLHEMVHLYNLENGIKDTSRGNMYHNKNFKIEAEKRGLSIERDEKYGWTKTSLNDEGKEFVASLEGTVFGLHRTPMQKAENGTKAKKKSSSRKYICPNCQQSIRATKEIRILCGECSTEDELVVMELESGDDEE